MTQLADQIASPNPSDILRDYTFSRIRLQHLGTIEEEFARQHNRAAALSAMGLPESLGLAIIAAASKDCAEGLLTYGMPGFSRRATSSSCLPFLAWVCLRIAHPEITRQKVADLLTPDKEAEVQKVVWDCLYPQKDSTPPKKEGAGSGASPPSASTGPSASSGAAAA